MSGIHGIKSLGFDFFSLLFGLPRKHSVDTWIHFRGVLWIIIQSQYQSTSDSLCEAVSQFFFILFFVIMVMFQCIINHFGRGLFNSDASLEVFE